MNKSQASFHLTVDGESVLSTPLGSSFAGDHGFPIGELKFCGFGVLGRESGAEYRVRIGDVLVEGTPKAYLKDLYWEDGAHFESAAGQVLVSLESRVAPADTWALRASLEVIVAPDKLGYSRYVAMTEDLRIISEGLVFDLISKSFRALHLGDVGGWGITSRAAHLELRVLEKLWAELSLCLRDIEMEPVTHLRLIRERCRYRGTERLNQSGIRELAMAGIHPKWNRVSRPLSVIRERLEETTATPEHRIVAGFLRFLRARIEDCRNRAEKSIEAIEAYRPVRDIQLSAGRTLYESHDVPRIHVLERACGRARHLESRIAEAQRLPFLPAAEPSLEVSLTPVFDHVRPYYRLRNIMLSYLRSSLVVLDAGLEERVKSTHRMYEQWVFLQIAASLRAGGLRCESYAGLLRQTGVYRFTFDLERNTTIVYKAADGRIVRLRYEPFVFPEQDAIARGETLYRGTRGDTPWCPDLLIEFCPRQKNPTDPLRPEYVVVLDAKYSKSIADRHWLAVDKYRQIRATHDRSAVVKQLWIAFPSEDDPVCRDPAVEWLSTGPNRPMTELVEGVIGMQPPSVAPTSPSDEGEILGHVQSAAFVSGLLTYLGIGKDQIESAVA